MESGEEEGRAEGSLRSGGLTCAVSRRDETHAAEPRLDEEPLRLTCVHALGTACAQALWRGRLSRAEPSRGAPRCERYELSREIREIL